MDIIDMAKREPSVEAWHTLCGALDELTDADVHGVIAELDEALTSWPDVERVAPIAWAASLTTDEPNPRLAVVRQVNFGTITEIRLAGDQLVMLAGHLGRFPITGLDLSVQFFGVRGLQKFLKNLGGGQLRRLDVRSSFEEGISGVRVLASCPLLGNLEELVLDNCRISNHGLMALVGSSTLTSLRRLSADGYSTPSSRRISDAGIELLLASPLREQLESLNLTYNAVSGAGALALMEGCPRLVELNLHGNARIDAPTLRRIGETARFAALTSVELEYWFDDLSAAAADVPALRQLDERFDVDDEPESANARFAELRAELSDERYGQWNRVVHHLSEWPPAENLEAALDYVEQHVAEWRDEHRPVPSHWWRSLLTDRPDPRARVARHLTIDKWHSIDDDERQMLDANWATTGLTSLTWEGDAVRAQKAFWANVRLEGLRRLDVTGIQKVSIARALAASEALEGVETLIGRGFSVPQDCTGALLSTPKLARLRTLVLNHTSCGDHVLEALAESEHLEHLEELQLDSCRLTTLDPLEHARHLTSLRHLVVRYNQIEAASVAPNLSAPQFANLAVLDLSHNSLSSERLSFGHMPSLRRLDLGSTDLTPGWGAALSSSELPALENLRLGHIAGASAKDLAALVDGGLAANLKLLDLSGVVADGLPELAEAFGPELEILVLSRCRAGDSCLRALLRRHRPRLRRLSLGGNELTKAAMLELTHVELPMLDELDLYDNDVDDDVVVALLEAPGLGALADLRVSLHGLTARGLSALHGSARVSEDTRRRVATQLGRT